MGNIQSSSTKQILSSYTSVINDSVANIINSSTLNCTASNRLEVQTGGEPNCTFQSIDSTFNFNQNAVSNCRLISENINDISSTLQNTVKTTTENFINNDLQNKQGWFALAFSLQIANSSSASEVAQIISNQFNGQIENICRTQVGAFNHGTLLLCGAYSGTTFNYSQDAVSTAIASCVNQNIIRIFNTNSALSEMWSRTDNALASEQTGFNFKYLIIIGVIILAIIIIGLIIFLLTRGRGSKSAPATTTVTTAPK
jgi:hypothetical protein